jgi:hypothetical protein
MRTITLRKFPGGQMYHAVMYVGLWTFTWRNAIPLCCCRSEVKSAFASVRPTAIFRRHRVANLSRCSSMSRASSSRNL